MKPEMIMDALNNIDDAILKEAIAVRQVKKKRPFPKVVKILVSAACLVMIVYGAKKADILEFYHFTEKADVDRTEDIAQSDRTYETDSDEADGCDDLMPGDIWPVLMVNGKLYQWADVNLTQNQLKLQEDGTYTQDDYLPDSCRKVGEITSVTEDAPKEDLELQAGFYATGSVYVDDETSEAVYVRMTTDWFENVCIRFESDWLSNLEPKEHAKYLQRVAIMTKRDVEHISRIDFYADFEEPRYTISDPNVIRKIGMELANFHIDPPEDTWSHTYENALDVRIMMDNGDAKCFVCEADAIYLVDLFAEKDIYSMLMENGVKQ